MRLRVAHLHSQFWPILARFVDYYSLFWGPGVISTINKPWVRLRFGHQHSRFLSILTRFMDYYSLFWGPGVISTINEFLVRFRFGHQHSRFWPILTRFVDYYSPFWGPKAISIVVEPQGAITCWSSTLTVLADFGPFHGLLLTVLRSRSDFHD